MPEYTTGNPALLNVDVGPLVVQPVERDSVASRVSTVVHTNEHTMKLPTVTADPAAAWVAEGEPITESELTTAETLVVPAKVAGLLTVSRELADDSTPAAADLIGAGLVRSIVTKVDAAYFGNEPAPAPAGLAALTGVTTITAAAGFADLDAFAEAIAAVEALGVDPAECTFVASPGAALALAQLKQGTASVAPLLATGSDVSQPTARRIFGVPLATSPALTGQTVWLIPRSRSFLVIRDDATVEISTHAKFDTDEVQVRAIMRVGFGFPHKAALVKITTP